MIPTEKLLRDRCIEVGDCLLWQQGGGSPILSLSAKERARAVRPIAYELMVGPIPPGHFTFVVCHDKRCISPKCMRCGTKSDYMRNASANGAYSTLEKSAAQTRAKRAISPHTIETAREVRASRAAGETLIVIADRYGRSIDWVSKIAHGRIWRDSPAGSIFSQPRLS